MPTSTKKTPARAELPLGEMRKAMTAVDADLRTGARELYGDFEVYVRSARRDTVKLVKALRGDVEQMVKAIVPPEKPKPAATHAVPRPRHTPPRAGARRPRQATPVHP